MRAILIWNYEAVSMIPEGSRSIFSEQAPKGTEHQQLSTEYKRLYHFVKGGNDVLKSLRRETMFIQLLEGLHADEIRIHW